jgi:hypothetical protein
MTMSIEGEAFLADGRLRAALCQPTAEFRGYPVSGQALPNNGGGSSGGAKWVRGGGAAGRTAAPSA